MRRTTQNSIFSVFALILMVLGCQQQEFQQPELDKDFHIHFNLIEQGKTGSARVRLRQWMDANGETSQPLFLMGLSYHHDKQYTKAVEWFQKSTAQKEVKKHYPPAWHFLGWSQYYLGHTEHAVASFRHYLALNPEEGDTLFGLGLLAMESGEFHDAEQLFSKSIAAQESHPKGKAKSLARLADVYAELDRWETSLTTYKDALQLNPDLYEAWYHLAMAYRRLGYSDQADIAMEQFLLARDRVRPDLARTRFPE